MIRLRVLLGTAASLAATALAACAPPDAPTAPRAAAVATFAKGSSPSDKGSPKPVVTKYGDTTVTTFTVDPTIKAAYGIAGEHKIKFFPGNICDPAQSTYGPTEWNQPCVPLTTPITITARSWRDAQRHPRVDFSPALRFVRAKGNLPRLYLLDKRSDASELEILYCPDVGTCVDESIADPELATQYDKTAGFLYRDIKHFSGYGVGIGRSMEEWE